MQQLLQNLIDVSVQIPEYARSLITGRYMIPSIVALVILLIAMLFSNKFANLLRTVFILCAVALGAFAFSKHNYELLGLCLLLVIVLLLVRLIRYTFVTVRQNRINRKIEQKALAKAQKRRGSWKEKQGYSGERLDEQKDGVSGSEALPSAAAEEPSETEDEEADAGSDSYMSRSQFKKAMEELTDLKELGLLTEEEFNQKKAILYSRLG
jgi:hypothetical protein